MSEAHEHLELKDGTAPSFDNYELSTFTFMLHQRVYYSFNLIGGSV
jgi:hypothetical protein